MTDWFGDTVVVESNPDTTWEEHRKPREIWKFRFFVVFAQLDVRVLRKQKPDHKYEPNVLGQDVQPREVHRDPVRPTPKLGREFWIAIFFVINQYGGDKAPQYERREQRRDPVESKKPVVFLLCFNTRARCIESYEWEGSVYPSSSSLTFSEHLTTTDHKNLEKGLRGFLNFV